MSSADAIRTGSAVSFERKTDEWGRVRFAAGDAFELLYADLTPGDTYLAEDPEIETYNLWCSRFDKPHSECLPVSKSMPLSPQEEHARRSSTWAIPTSCATLDVRAYLLGLCSRDEERKRVEEEMALFEAQGLVPVLRAAVHLVEHFRRRGIVWGVGRGSSVASYCLYLIGLHRVDSLRHGLDIREFLR